MLPLLLDGTFSDKEHSLGAIQSSLVQPNVTEHSCARVSKGIHRGAWIIDTAKLSVTNFQPTSSGLCLWTFRV